MNIVTYEGAPYKVGTGSKSTYRKDYIRFEWSNGFLDMKKYHWDKLSQRRKNCILKIEK